MKKFTILMLALAAGAYLHAQDITETLAGTGATGYSGDGNWSVNAQINGPKDVCVDAANNIYFTDHNNGVIRRIAALNGIITTIAGGGTSTLSGIPATTASLSPNYLCVSGTSLYVTSLNQIRKINLTTGVITTVAGSATAGGYTGDGGAALSALLDTPTGICVDAASNLYFVDRGNSVVRKITAAGVISTIAGTRGTTGYTGDGGLAAVATLYEPACICVDAAGNLYVSDQEPNYPNLFSYSVIRKITAGTGIISTIAGVQTGGSTYGVPATAAELGTITGMCCDGSGNIYCNEMSCSCRELDMASGMLNIVGGNFGVESYANGVASPVAYMSYPMGIGTDHAGNVYVADSGNNRIRKIMPLSNTPTFCFGTGEFIKTTPGAAGIPIANMLVITDLDATATETWTVATAPIHGTLSGLPASAPSGGTDTISGPATFVTYYPPGYVTNDQFTIKVANGTTSGTVTVYVEVGTTTAVGSVAATAQSISIFPNPASSVVNIAWSGLQPQSNSLEIMDLAGRLWYSSEAAAGTSSTQVNIAALPAGTYLLRMNGTEATKFVKE